MTLFVIFFYVLLLSVVLNGKVHYIIILYYLMLGLLTFIMYTKDKHASRYGFWRVSETTLHTLSLFGGWTGAVLGQNILRHKTQKQPFKTLFNITIFINILFFYLLLFFT